MKHEQSAPAGYRPRFAGTMKLYLVRHKEYGELTVNGVNKYEAVHAAARAWGVRWTAIARECEYIVLAEDTPEAGTLWIPSATDVFGAGDWWNEEPDSFQLEIFKRERDRVKEHVGDGTWFWWLRSPSASVSYSFVRVYADGTVGYTGAYYSLGFAPGFDL